MKILVLISLATMGLPLWSAVVLFEDTFQGKLGPGWSWVRENPAGWRVTEKGLEVRVEPGNMWGGANNARNVLTRLVPEVNGTVEACVTLENKPTNQYEQVDLVWYYDDSHMVKLGQELVDGKLSIVMGREEKDQTRTICIIPIQAAVVQVRFQVRGDEIHGEFRAAGERDWKEAGKCSLPVSTGKPAKISLQCYQGSPDKEHWAKLSDFQVRHQP